MPLKCFTVLTWQGSKSGSWLVSGGYGALGTLMASWLVTGGAQRVCLLGRSGRPQGAGNIDILVPILASDAAVTLSR